MVLNVVMEFVKVERIHLIVQMTVAHRQFVVMAIAMMAKTVVTALKIVAPR